MSTEMKIPAIGLVFAVALIAGTPTIAQDAKVWRHGVIEPGIRAKALELAGSGH